LGIHQNDTSCIYSAPLRLLARPLLRI
jgi:hypothetical protein